jgi:hypothetical protein
MRIKYMFIVQRYGLMSAAAGGGFCSAMWSPTGIVGLGGSDPEGRGGKARGRSDQSRTLRQASLLSPPMALTASSTLLTIRTPRTTSSEIAVAL